MLPQTTATGTSSIIINPKGSSDSAPLVTGVTVAPLLLLIVVATVVIVVVLLWLKKRRRIKAASRTIPPEIISR